MVMKVKVKTTEAILIQTKLIPPAFRLSAITVTRLATRMRTARILIVDIDIIISTIVQIGLEERGHTGAMIVENKGI
jgi:hypothetical protein